MMNSLQHVHDRVATNTPRRQSPWLVLLLCAAPVLVQLIGVASKHYGYFIDEFYYIACSKRLAFGYVDHPPLSPLLLGLVRSVAGESRVAIRLPAFLGAAGTVWVTAQLTRELGGGRFATVLSAVTIGLSPILMAMTSFYSMNAFEPLLWTLVMLLYVRVVHTGDSRLWWVIGLLIGIAFENKHTVMVFVIAFCAGILLTRARRMLLDRWIYVGACVAAGLALPNLLWQLLNGWPSLEFYRNAQFLKNVPSPPLQSLLSQVNDMNPIALPVWLTGLAFFLAAPGAKELRAIGIMFVAVFAIYIASHTSRSDRILAGYPVLMAGGGVAIERFVYGRFRRIAWAYAIAIAGVNLAAAPLVVPLLPPARMPEYIAALGQSRPNAERGITSPIPQLLADRTGWESFIDDMRNAYQSLPREDQQKAILFVPDYGHAGAIELFGPSAGLPRVISPHNTYWHWSAGHTASEVVITIGATPDQLANVYEDVSGLGSVKCDYCMSWRSNMPILVARRPKVSADADTVWHKTKFYY